MFPSASVEGVAKEAAELLARVNAWDLGSLTDGEIADLVVQTHALMNLATAAHTAAVGALDARQAHVADGAATAKAWVAWQTHQSHEQAGATVRCARVLRDMPLVADAFAEGRLTPDHVRLLADARRANAVDFAEDEGDLVGLAEELTFRVFVTALRNWRLLHDADGEEGKARRRYDGRRAFCSRTFEDMVRLDAWLDPMGGATFQAELDRLEQQLYEADWADARQRLGAAATVADLARSAPQRRADALVEMARRSAARPADAKEPRYLLSVLMGPGSLQHLCELSDGTVVTPGEVLPILRWADVERIVFESPSRVLDVGVRQRVFTGATRRAVEVRDRTCVHVTCDVPAERCDVHHRTPWEHGGTTTQDNGECRCPFHHRHHHRATGPPTAA
jgi:hypothetical protein